MTNEELSSHSPTIGVWCSETTTLKLPAGSASKTTGIMPVVRQLMASDAVSS